MRFVVVFYLVFLASIVFLADTGHRDILKVVEYLPFKDKSGHFLLIGMAAFWLNLSLRCKVVRVVRKDWLLGSMIFVALSTTEEFSQIFIATRTFSFYDMLSNWLGIFCFGFAAKWVASRWLVSPNILETKPIDD